MIKIVCLFFFLRHTNDDVHSSVAPRARPNTFTQTTNTRRTSSKSFIVVVVVVVEQQQQRRKKKKKKHQETIGRMEKSYEIPQSTVLRLDTHDIDIRVVEPYAVAITPYENREEGLARLTMYMEGENETGEHYPPTQPLTMRYALDEEEEKIVGKTMELYLGPRALEDDERRRRCCCFLRQRRTKRRGQYRRESQVGRLWL